MIGKLAAAGIAFPVAVAGVAAFTLLALATGSSSSAAAADCPAGKTQASSSVAVDGLTSAQLGNAAAAIAVGRTLGVPDRGLVVVLAAERQESDFRNLANPAVPESLTLNNDGTGSNYDSVGVLQQRASWGTVPQRMDPTFAARSFLTRLLGVPGWQSMTVTQAAQAVQVSGTPDAYAQWQPLAEQILANASGLPPVTSSSCVQQPPVAVGGKAGLAVKAAESNLGTMYQFGGSCLDSHSADPSGHCDCSSLVMTAWKAAGVTLPRVSDDQYLATARVPGASPTNLAVLQPGDLLFYNPGEDGRPGLPGHVALYLGGGKLIEAPFQGQPVHITAVYAAGWLGAGRVAA